MNSNVSKMPTGAQPLMPAENTVGKMGERIPATLCQWVRKMFAIGMPRKFSSLDKYVWVGDQDGRPTEASTIRIESMEAPTEDNSQLRPAIIINRGGIELAANVAGQGGIDGGLPAEHSGRRGYRRSVGLGLDVLCVADNYSECNMLSHEVWALVDQFGIYFSGDSLRHFSAFTVGSLSKIETTKKDSGYTYGCSIGIKVGFDYCLWVTPVEPVIRKLYLDPTQI